jgi:hypothetical protein
MSDREQLLELFEAFAESLDDIDDLPDGRVWPCRARRHVSLFAGAMGPDFAQCVAHYWKSDDPDSAEGTGASAEEEILPEPAQT